MPELQPFAVAGEHDEVIARDRSSAQGREADRAFLARAGQPGAPVGAVVGERHAAACRRRLAEQQRGARRRVDLVAMVRLDDLDVPIVPEPLRRLAYQRRQQRDAERGVSRL